MDLKNLGPWKPNVTESIVELFLKEIYGLEVILINGMHSFNDQNFFIKVSEKHENPFIRTISKDGYTFKIINTKKSAIKGHFSSMHKTLRTLSCKGLNVPLPVTNLDNTTYRIQDIPLLDDESNGSGDITYGKCGFHLLNYLPGTSLSSVDWTENMLFDCGLMLAKLHAALQDFICPDMKAKEILYRLTAVPFLKEIISTGTLSDEIQELTLKTLEDYDREVKPVLDRLSTGFIHGDFNDYNILVDNHDGTDVASGIIDFEDVHYGHYVWDVSLMLAHLLLNSKAQDPMEDVGIALAGYLSRRSFSELEMSLIKTCIECRLCQTLDFCTWSRTINPSNEYISGLSLDSRRKFLEQVRGCSKKDLLDKWRTVRQNCCSKRNVTMN